MSGREESLSTLARALVIVLLVGAPLAEAWGFTTPYTASAFVLIFGAGLASVFLNRDSEPLPARGWLVAFFVLVLFQLAPLPSFLLRILSPGSSHLYSDELLLPSGSWAPISVNPLATARGLLDFFARCVLYFVVFREFRGEWKRRLVWLLVGVGLFLTLEGLYQTTSAYPHRIYTIFPLREDLDWAVFGAFAGKNQFAGYMVMVAPLGLGLAAEAWQRVFREWVRRKKGWLVLGESLGTRALWRSAVAMVLTVGVFAPQSRGGLGAFVLSACLLPLAFRHKLRALGFVVLLAMAGALWVDFGDIVHGFETRGIRGSRIDLWIDALRVLPDFPIFGVGLGAFGRVFLHYQTLWRAYVFGTTHSDYIQILVDTGAVGLFLAGGGLVTVLLRAAPAAQRSALNAGLLAALLGSMAHVAVDFDWQVPANAWTFIALAALIVQPQKSSSRGAFESGTA